MARRPSGQLDLVAYNVYLANRLLAVEGSRAGGGGVESGRWRGRERGAGAVEANPLTGQLTTLFLGIPALGDLNIADSTSYGVVWHARTDA